MKKIAFITSNWMKFLTAQKAIENSDIQLEQVKLDPPEIQDLNPCKVATFSAQWAANKLGKPVFKEDNAFCIETINNFPGAFVAYIDQTIGEKGILKLMQGKNNRKAKYILAVAYCEPWQEPIVEFDELHGTISEKLEGDYGWFSDKFFIPKGYNKPMWCYPDNERVKIWPHSFWHRITKIILK